MSGTRSRWRIWTFERVIADPEHFDHDEIKEWMGDYDLKAVGETVIRMAVGRVVEQLKVALAEVH